MIFHHQSHPEFWFFSYRPKCCWPIKLQYFSKCNISSWYCHFECLSLLLNAKVFCKLIVSFCVCVVRHAKITQDNKFAIYLQYLKQNVKELVKHHRFLQIDTIILGVCGQTCPIYPKKNKFTFSLQYVKRELIDKVDFLHADKHESFLQTHCMIFDGNGQAFSKFLK